MKVGDLVKWHGTVATIVKEYKRAVPDGNPDGDWRYDRSWDILVGAETIRIKRQLPVVNCS